MANSDAYCGIRAALQYFDNGKHALDNYGIDSYAIYVEDMWRPGHYIPHDVDDSAIYPETQYHGISDDWANLLKDVLNVSSADTVKVPEFNSPIQFRFLSDTSKSKLRAYSPFSESFKSFNPLFGNYIDREQICSTVLASPVVPAIDKATCPEYLFLNFRHPTKFSNRTTHNPLHHLAGVIFQIIRDQTIDRSRNNWNTPLLRTTRASSRIRDFVSTYSEGTSQNQRLQMPHALLSLLEHTIITMHDRQCKLNCSIHLLQTNTGKLTLETVSQSSGPSGGERLNQICDGSEASITLCATLTGTPLALNYIAPEGHVSVTIHASSLPLIREFANKHNDVFMIVSSPEQGRGCRLVARNDISLIKNIFNECRDPEISDILMRLIKRLCSSHEQLYRSLHRDWPRAMSEVCHPLYRGSQSIGCINIESDTPFIWYPYHISLLKSIADSISVLLSMQLQDAVRDTVQRAAYKIHGATTFEEAPRALDRFAKSIQRHILANFVDLVAAQTHDSSWNYHRVACSKDGWRNPHIHEPLPRHDGFTHAIVSSEDPEEIGVVIEVASKTELNKIITGVWKIKRFVPGQESDVSNRSNIVLTKLDKISWPSSTFNITTPNDSSKRIVGLRLYPPNDRSRLGQDLVIWCAFADPETITTDDKGSKDAPHYWQVHRATRRLQDKVSSLVQIADDCALGPIAWLDHLAAYREYYHDLTHGRLREILSTLEDYIGECEHYLTDSESFDESFNVCAKLRDATLLARYVRYKANALQDLRLYDQAASLASTYKNKDECSHLMDRVNSAWRVSNLLVRRDVQPTLVQIDNGVKNAQVIVDREPLCVLLTEVFLNSLLHGRGEDELSPFNVYVSLQQTTDSELIILDIMNDGIPFTADKLADWNATDPIIKASGRSAKRGRSRSRGVPLILQLSRAICDQPAIAINISQHSGKTCPGWRFFIPAVCP